MDCYASEDHERGGWRVPVKEDKACDENKKEKRSVTSNNEYESRAQ
jgi:hypothetical protein